MNKMYIWAVMIAFLLFCSTSVNAEQKQTLGPWDVHYIAFPTTFLTPEIAKANGFIRSKYNAIINISVLDKHSQVAQRIDISGTARNLIGTTKELKFKRVIEEKLSIILLLYHLDIKKITRLILKLSNAAFLKS